MATKRGITATEVVRRAVGIQSVIDKGLEDHGDLMIAYRNDQGEHVGVHQITDLT